MKHLFLCVAILATSISSNALAKGALDFVDYCKSEQAKFKSTSDALKASLNATKNRVDGWYKSPETMPDSALKYYRAIVFSASFREWEKTASGQALLKAWKAADPNVNVWEKYLEEIYKIEIGPEKEKELAITVFKYDYENNLKTKLNEGIKVALDNIAAEKSKLDDGCKPDVLNQVLRATLGRAILTYDRNKEASEREKGDIAKLVRRFTGISVTDILKNGLRGGEGSEIRKLQKAWIKGLDNIGIGKNHFLREASRKLDPTNQKLPDGLKITIDGRSGKNLIKNLTGGLIK